MNDLAELTRETAAAPDAGATLLEAGSERHSAPPAVSSYDTVPYSVCAFAQTRPDRLAAIAALFGMDPAPPDHCRVLELGCASGGNLIPMALSWPGSQFEGIDLSQRQVRDGQQMVRELDLQNVELKCQSILDVSRDLGMFDYILCHGVYSWVPPDVQNRILEICRDHLRPQGIAYISYNTFPGWHARAAIREMLCYHTEQFDDPSARIREARALLAFLVRSVGTRSSGFSSLIRQELAVLLATPNTYLLHEHLEEYNEPLYFHQFIDRAAEKNLQYLGEAQIATMLPWRLGPEIEKTLRAISHDLLQMEQYMDFLRNRIFRQTLLCHEHMKLNYTLRPEAVQKLWIASSAKPLSPESDLQSDAPLEFGTRDSSQEKFITRLPLMKAAMMRLAAVWPESMLFEDLLTAAADVRTVAPEDPRTLATQLLHGYISGLMELSPAPPRLCSQVSDRPLASPYARLRAREDSKVVNMRLESTVLSPAARLVLRNLDGEHDRTALVTLVEGWLRNEASTKGAGVETALKADEYLDQLLHSFSKGALLIG